MTEPQLSAESYTPCTCPGNRKAGYCQMCHKMRLPKKCISPLAKRPILYTDTVNGEQTLRDDLWAVTTDELNALATALDEQKQGYLSKIRKLKFRYDDRGAECYDQVEVLNILNGKE